MVWSQYVYEATVGYDVIPSDEEEIDDDVHLSVEDWQIKYSDELWELWRRVEQLIHDAFLEHTLMTECTFSDFAEFCYNEHHGDCDFVWIARLLARGARDGRQGDPRRDGDHRQQRQRIRHL